MRRRRGEWPKTSMLHGSMSIPSIARLNVARGLDREVPNRILTTKRNERDKMQDLTAEQEADLDHAYGYHAPTPEQVGLYRAINDAAKNFERVVLQTCPSSADRTFATRQI